MGIEPFLIVGIVALMFLVQVARAGHTALFDRLEYSLLTMDGAGEHAARRAMSPETSLAPPGEGSASGAGAQLPVRRGSELLPDLLPSPLQSWREQRPGGLLVRLLACRRPGPARRILRQATGVDQRAIGQHRKWLAPSILVIVQLPRPIASRLLISPRRKVVPEHRRVPLASPVLDHVLRVSTDEPASARSLLAEARVHEPLIELMAQHPLSVVTEGAVALWCTRAVHDPEPLVRLAEEVARAMLDTAQSAHEG